MKKGLLIICLFAVGCSNSNTSNKAQKNETLSKNDSTNIVLKEELPKGKTCESDLGILKINDNGESIGKKTELTELLRLLNTNDCDIIEINYEIKGTDGDPNISKELIYNKREERLQDIYTENNVIEDYKNVSTEGLKMFLKKGEKSFYSLSNYTNAKYDFNNREMKQATVGPAPSQSEFDGSVKIIEDYVKAKANDPSSIKFLEWSKVSPYGNFWVVRCMFKGTNSFGSIVIPIRLL